MGIISLLNINIHWKINSSLSECRYCASAVLKQYSNLDLIGSCCISSQWAHCSTFKSLVSVFCRVKCINVIISITMPNTLRVIMTELLSSQQSTFSLYWQTLFTELQITVKF